MAKARARTRSKITMSVSKREFSTILAALRMWQEDVTDGMTETCGIPVDFADIALDAGDACTSAEIDALIERIN